MGKKKKIEEEVEELDDESSEGFDEKDNFLLEDSGEPSQRDDSSKDDSSKDDSSKDDSGEPEFFEEFFEEIPGENFETVSDFSIGDIGLATANTGGFWKGNLESSLIDEPSANWEEKKEEREENNFYQGGVDEREKKAYSEIEHGSDFYTGGGRGVDLYASDSGNYNAKDESGEFYDPRIGKRADIEEVRQADRSKLEITGLQGGFGRGTEKDIKGKRKDNKYNN